MYGTTTRLPAWRLEGLPRKNVRLVDLLVDSNLDQLLDEVRPRTIFNCVAYGALLLRDRQRSSSTRRTSTSRPGCSRGSRRGRSPATSTPAARRSTATTRPAPQRTDPTAPNSDYAVSKVAAANLIHYFGRKKGLPCANLRLYSVYGPLEDSSRLIPNVIRYGVEGRFPEFVSPDVSRDFVYVDDVTEAFVDAALNLPEPYYGESFNIGTGRKTTIGDVAAIAGRCSGSRPSRSSPCRAAAGT